MDIKEFKGQLPENQLSFNATRLLARPRKQFKNAAMKKHGKKMGTALVARHFLAAQMELTEELNQMLDWIEQVLKEGQEIYMVDLREKWVKKDGTLSLIPMKTGRREWSRAYKQNEEIQNAKESEIEDSSS